MHVLKPRLAAISASVLLTLTFSAPEALSVEISSSSSTKPGDKSDSAKDAEKAAKEAAKDAEKAAKEAAKDAEKAAKEAEKAAKEAAKQAEKAAAEAEKAVDKASKEAAKDASKQAEGVIAAAARAEAAAAAVRLIAQFSDEDIRRQIRDEQRETRSQFRALTSEGQSDFESAKKQARSDYKVALAAADEAESKAERKRLRQAAREEFDQAKKRNRSAYLAALEDARRYNGKAQLIFFDPGVTQMGEYDPAIAVAAVATSGLPVDITSLTVETCEVVGGLLTPLSPGTCILAATQAGNDTYAPASVNVEMTIIDQPDPQQVVFSALPDLQVGAPAQQLSASASSGLPVTFASLSPTVCSVEGTVVTALASGTCVVRASQAGDAQWQAADPVDRSGSVTAAPEPEPSTSP